MTKRKGKRTRPAQSKRSKRSRSGHCKACGRSVDAKSAKFVNGTLRPWCPDCQDWETVAPRKRKRKRLRPPRSTVSPWCCKACGSMVDKEKCSYRDGLTQVWCKRCNSWQEVVNEGYIMRAARGELVRTVKNAKRSPEAGRR
jgi:hypothetical protein